MKAYKMSESINEEGRFVCGVNCKTIKYTLNKTKAENFANENTCPMVCRCIKTIEIEED